MEFFRSKEKLSFLSGKQKTELNKHFSQQPVTTAHELAVLLGIDYSIALVVLAILETEGLCENKLLIYHRCKPDVAVDAIPFGQGFPNLPWVCPECKEEVKCYHELSFDVVGRCHCHF